MYSSDLLARAYEPLTYVPILHTCGHFELRYTRYYAQSSCRHNRGSELYSGYGFVCQAGCRGLSTQSPVGPFTQPDEFRIAGNPCSQCNAQGRPVEANYATLQEAQTAATLANANDPRQREHH